jgi:predicted transcriptional regulator
MRRLRRRGRPVAVPDAELAVLKVLWESGPASIREIADVLYPDGQTSHYATVQKLLERLRERGCVSRRRAGRAHVFRAIVERSDLIRERLRDAAEKLCEGSLTPLLTHLVVGRQLSRQEIDALRRLIDELDEGGR